MATFTIVSPLPDLDSIEADGFFIAEGYVQFTKRVGNSDVIIKAVTSELIESVTKD